MTRLRRLSLQEARDEGVGYYFSQPHADHAVDFIEKYLVHSKGRWSGQRFSLLQWQKTEVIEELFGWLRVADNTRRYRVGYITTPKKNGKSTLLAGIGLYLLVADQEPGAEVYGCGVDREQASIVFREAASMVRASPSLSRSLEVVESRRTVSCLRKASFYKVLAGDSFRAEGLNIHGLLFDELHAQRSRSLWDSLRYGGASRTQPLLLSITTAGYDRNSICYEQHVYAKRVLSDWTVDPTFYAFIGGADDDDDWTKPETWAKANPSWGTTISPDDFAADFREAQLSTTKENSFRRYRLNQWTQQDTRWIKMEVWDSCNKPPPEPLGGKPCWLGLDLAWSQDTSALVAVFPAEDGTVDVLAKFYIPGDMLVDRERRDRFPYSQYVREGIIVATGGNVTDYDFIRKDVEQFAQQYQVRRIAIDRYNATHLSNQLQGMGLDVVGWPQGFAGMNAPSRMLENMLANGRLRHNGNPVLNWQANNASVRQNAEGMIRPLKPRQNGSERVDGIIALVQALGVWSAEQQKPADPEPQIILL